VTILLFASLPFIYFLLRERGGGIVRERINSLILCIPQRRKERGREREKKEKKKEGTSLPLKTDPRPFGPCDLQDP
jgi:hypothetical protein